MSIDVLPLWRSLLLVATMGCLTAASGVAQPLAGDAQRGAQLYRSCAACHSLEPDRNMTGPSLAGVMGRKVGSLQSFMRYSPALKQSGVMWTEKTLDAWLESPSQFVPDNRMTFPGIKNNAARADLITFLAQASSAQAQPRVDNGAAMGGMMGGERRDLKTMPSKHQVRAIYLCRDTYRVTTADGETEEFWEPNLRFITDGGDLGPAKAAPVIMRAGMMGDRASVFFATPDEISRFISHQC